MTRSAPSSDDLHVLRLVAHELRAHLTVLNGYSELMLDDPRVRRDPGRVEHALREMRSHLACLNDIAAHLSESVNGGRAARLPVAMTDFDMAAAAREAVGMTAEVARRHRVRLPLDDASLGDDPVHGDRFQLVMAMRNLLDNACSHGPDGADALLEVRRSGGDVEVGVRDCGRGLDQLGADAFEPMRRGDAEAGGMGLGLSLVAEVARAHGGKVLWQSGDGWSRIGLRFPDQSHA
jgi:signal transduction histidine kinase